MINRLFYNEAFNQALKSDMSSNHGAIVTFRGKIIGKGYNKYSNDSKKASEHAEVSALKSAMNYIGKDNLSKCELIIIRVNKAGECVNSKPCYNCQRFINFYSVKKVYYSTDS